MDDVKTTKLDEDFSDVDDVETTKLDEDSSDVDDVEITKLDEDFSDVDGVEITKLDEDSRELLEPFSCKNSTDDEIVFSGEERDESSPQATNNAQKNNP